MRTIPLHGAKANGRVALVDDEDYELIMQYRWFVWEYMRRGRRPNGPYAVTNVQEGKRRVQYKMHALLTGYPMTDHENHDGLDNQRSNLRPATMAQNQHNKRHKREASSQYKGVYWFGRQNEWRARIRSDGPQRYLGAFKIEEDAAMAYDAAAREAFGEYACLNFPDHAA